MEVWLLDAAQTKAVPLDGRRLWEHAWALTRSGLSGLLARAKDAESQTPSATVDRGSVEPSGERSVLTGRRRQERWAFRTAAVANREGLWRAELGLVA